VALMPSALWKPVGVLIREGAEVACPASLAETSRPNHLGRYPFSNVCDVLGRDRKAARDCRIRGEHEIPESEEPLRVTAEHRTSEKRNGLTVGRLTHQRRRTEIWLCPAGRGGGAY
jgi:hypothetical protein